MSFSTPPSMPPGSTPEEEARRREEAVVHRQKYDELIAVVVALASFGGIFWWSVAQKAPGFNPASLSLNSSPGPVATASPFALGAASGGTAPNTALSSTKPAPAAKLDASNKSAPAESEAPVAPPMDLPKPAASAPPAGPIGMPATPSAPMAIAPPTTTPTPAASPPQATTPTPKASISFTDVPDDYWASPYIQELGKRGILEGTSGNFLPDKPVTRAEFAAMLQKAFYDKQPAKSVISFKDILPSYWALPAINEAVKMGFMNGYTDGNFRATKEIPKVEGIVALVTGLQVKDAATTDVAKLFQDSAQIPKWATDKMAIAAQAGLVVNHPESTLLNPTQALTRAETAALIYQALVKEGKAPAIASKFVVKP